MLKILVFGLSGAGKTTFAERLVKLLAEAGKDVDWYNADKVREENDDWDFSKEGRLRAAERMTDLTNKSQMSGRYSVADFIAPVPYFRNMVAADVVVFMDTVEKCEYEDTNEAFIRPDREEYNYRFTTYSDQWADLVANDIINGTVRPLHFDWTKPTAPLYIDHLTPSQNDVDTIEHLVHKAGQVCILFKHEPHAFDVVKQGWENLLDPMYKGYYTIIEVPHLKDVDNGN